MKLEKRFCPFCGHGLITAFWEGANRRFCTACNLPIYENPVPAACMILADEADRILLVKRSVDPRKGYWCLPGGFMELGESPETAALRELKEETGLSGRIERLLGVISSHSDLYHTVLLVGYLAAYAGGSPYAGDDAEAVNFFSYDEMPEIAFESHLKFIRLYHAFGPHGFSSTLP